MNIKTFSIGIILSLVSVASSSFAGPTGGAKSIRSTVLSKGN